MKNIWFILVLLPILTVGCAQMPQNAEQYRDGIKEGGFLRKQESFVVNRSFRSVSKTVKRLSARCLNKKLVAKEDLTGKTHDEGSFKSTFIAKGKKAELHVQHRVPGLNLFGSKEPKQGVYFLVIDMAKTSKNRTKVDAYYGGVNRRTIKAVIGWIKGEHQGCPNLIKELYRYY